jgi:hypothetical protein
MATTLLGYHYKENCAQCGYPNLINASREAEAPDPDEAKRNRAAGYRCINCRFYNGRDDGLKEVLK